MVRCSCVLLIHRSTDSLLLSVIISKMFNCSKIVIISSCQTFTIPYLYRYSQYFVHFQILTLIFTETFRFSLFKKAYLIRNYLQNLDFLRPTIYETTLLHTSYRKDFTYYSLYYYPNRSSKCLFFYSCFLLKPTTK